MTPVPHCSKCSTPLPAAYLNVPQLNPCPGCAAPIRAEIFPAFFRNLAAGNSGETLLVDSEASCFYHQQKKAAGLCSACGRFLCALCDVELEGAHYCPACLESSQQKGKLASIDNERKMYDTLALHLAIVSVPLFYVSFITAPISLYYAIKYWNHPRSIVRGNSHWRQVMAIICSSLLLLGWCVFVGWLIFRR